MSKLKVIYFVSLVILVVLMAFTVFRPMVVPEKFSTVSWESIIQGEDEWIIQFDIINREGEVRHYIIEWSIGGEIYNSQVARIENERTFTIIHHIYPETVKEGKVHITVRKEGDATAFEECTYYIRFD